MESRGQKRAEEAEDLRVDKRPCSNLDFRPRSPRVVPDVSRNADMDTSSSASASSSRSEEEEDPGRDSGYASCDSDDAEPTHSSLRAFQRSRSSNDHVRLRSALACLNQATESSALVAALTELCEVLSFCAEGSMSSLLAESLSPVLVRLARHESNHPHIMLFAIRALTYMCDAFPRASSSLVKHEAVLALCQRLMAIEYMDVAEQCLQALEKISRDQPHACLQAGAIMAVLSYIEFFSTSVQRVAVSTVVNICKKLPADCSSPLMDAVPILCNLLQYEDRQLVENVAICLIKIAERASESSEMLDELCKHGLINKASRLIHLNSHTTLSQPLYNGLIGLLVKLCSGSNLAFRTLYELNIYSILKDILASHDLSHGMSFAYVVDGQGNQVSEILKLLSELLPPVAKDQEVHSQMQISEKETFIMEHPDLLHKFGSDVLPILVQVVNTGASIYICYGCLSVIYKLIYFSNSDVLVELLRDADIPSFLAGVFTRTDHHVLMMALRIAETILLKYSDHFLNSFIKEGVFFAIDALMATEKCPQSMFPKFNVAQLPLENSQKLVPKVSLSCLCYAFDTGQGLQSSETGNCMLEKDSVQNLAKHIKNSYFCTKLNVSDKGFTDILEKLRALSADLSNLMHLTAHKDDSLTQEGQFSCVVQKLIEALNGKEHVSNFEFIESGLVGSLANYLSNRHDLTEEVEIQSKFENDGIVVKRFEVFGKMLLSSSDAAEEFPLLNLIQKLQGALSSLEDFPVILTHQSRQKNSYAVVPNGHCISYPCLKVRFLRREGETGLREYSDNALSVDPFSSLDAIEGFLLPKVRIVETEKVEAVCQSLDAVESIGFESPKDVSTIQWETSGHLDSDDTPMDLLEVQEQEQEQEANLSQTSSGGVLDSGKIVSAETSSNNSHTITPSQGVNHSPGDQISMGNQYPSSYSNKYGAPKLVFYLEGQQLDQKYTLYQAILQQRLKAEPGTETSAKLWSKVYTLSYGKSLETEVGECQQYSKESDGSTLLDESRMQYASFFSSVLDCALPAVVDQSSPTYGILYLLKILEGVNRFGFYLMSCERMHTFAQGLIDNLDDIKLVVPSVPHHEFISSKLTEKLEQQMRDSLAVSVGGLPLWCNQLMLSCPFLFSFEAKCKYFKLAAFGTQQVQRSPPLHSNPGSGDRQASPGSLARKKFMVNRERILDCASEMMDRYASAKLPIEVVYNEEVGTGLGPTLEFYTLVSHEFQKLGLGMWRGDRSSSDARKSVMNPFGLFPRPWPSTSETSDGMQFADVIKRFVLLGQVVAKALQDGRVLDLPFSKAFYKLILQQELNLYDIQSFDPELGRALIEFKAIIRRNENMKSNYGESSSHASEVCFRNSKIEDLCLDFTLPGYPEHHLSFHQDNKMVNLANLEEYITLTVDGTLHSGISRQVEAFKCGFNKVFPIHHLQIFTEEEIERLLCGEHDFLNVNELLDHVKFDHGYTASSLPILHLLEIIREFDYEERRAFLQFVTGAPRLPPGGLASLNPKLTIVRKHCGSSADADLPSVMTCANYLKLPSYSSKEKMKEKLLYAITEGQGSFHLS